MKSMLTSTKGLFALLLAFGITTAQARMRYFIDDSFADDFFGDMFEDHFEHMREQMKQMQKHFARYSTGPNKEERQALKAARENLSKIQAKVDSDDQNVYIRFNLDGVNKNDIKIEKKAHDDFVGTEADGFKGTIPAKDGKVEFFISSYYLKVGRQVELKKENTREKAEEKKNGAKESKKQADEKEQEKQPVYYYSNSAMHVTSLPHPIDLSSAHASTKDNTLTITIEKKKEAVLPIAHN